MPVKVKTPSKKELKLDLFWNEDSPSVEIRATVISNEGYNYENLNSLRPNLILSTLTGSKISFLVIVILFNK